MKEPSPSEYPINQIKNEFKGNSLLGKKALYFLKNKFIFICYDMLAKIFTPKPIELSIIFSQRN